MAAAEEEYASGMAAHAAGRFDECVALLTTASRSPQLRFATASLLGRIHRQFGRTDRAIEWFEQAAQAPPPSREEGHLLLYDLADVLESSGEDTRALAVWKTRRESARFWPSAVSDGIFPSGGSTISEVWWPTTFLP